MLVRGNRVYAMYQLVIQSKQCSQLSNHSDSSINIDKSFVPSKHYVLYESQTYGHHYQVLRIAISWNVHPADVQHVVTVLQLKVIKCEPDVKSALCLDDPEAVGVVGVHLRVPRRRDDTGLVM